MREYSNRVPIMLFVKENYFTTEKGGDFI